MVNSISKSYSNNTETFGIKLKVTPYEINFFVAGLLVFNLGNSGLVRQRKLVCSKNPIFTTMSCLVYASVVYIVTLSVIKNLNSKYASVVYIVTLSVIKNLNSKSVEFLH